MWGGRVGASHVCVVVDGDEVRGRTPEVRPHVDLGDGAVEDADGGEVADHAVVEAGAGAGLDGLGGGDAGGGQEGEQVLKGDADLDAVLVDLDVRVGQGADADVVVVGARVDLGDGAAVVV